MNRDFKEMVENVDLQKASRGNRVKRPWQDPYLTRSWSSKEASEAKKVRWRMVRDEVSESQGGGTCMAV